MSSSADIQCHYEVLGVPLDADMASIKKAHRKKALQYHPDKNIDNDECTQDKFRRVQEAYECLSDPVERKWYDEHRDAILKGWSGTGGDKEEYDILFDVVPFMYAGCYKGYGDDYTGFFQVYKSVFEKIYTSDIEPGTAATNGGNEKTTSHTPHMDFGTSNTPWEEVSAFYTSWESFSSQASFAWCDAFDVLREADNRRVRRAMEDENKKLRKIARRERNDDVLALVRFVKKRDPRVKARKLQLEVEKAKKDELERQQMKQRKHETQKAREQWRQQAEDEFAAAEEVDRLAGRIRLADLDDDYDYGGGKGKKGKKGKKKKGKNKNKKQANNDSDNDDEKSQNDEGDGENNSEKNDDNKSDTNIAEIPNDPDCNAEVKPDADIGESQEADSADQDETTSPSEAIDSAAPGEEVEHYDSDSEEEEPDVWRCECCKKDFKSEAQLENHAKSKKHKAALKKYEQKMAQLERELMDDLLDEDESQEE